jgi:hypothetical protein
MFPPASIRRLPIPKLSSIVASPRQHRDSDKKTLPYPVAEASLYGVLGVRRKIFATGLVTDKMAARRLIYCSTYGESAVQFLFVFIFIDAASLSFCEHWLDLELWCIRRELYVPTKPVEEA